VEENGYITGGILVYSEEFGWGTFCDDYQTPENEATISRELGMSC
jgi:hypothetical protein